jgi:hypothetical protein
VRDFVLPGHPADEMDFQHASEVARAFDRLLKHIDDKLFCFWVRVDAVAFDNPGRWHIGRLHSNPELNTYWVIQTPDGGYREPAETDLEWLREHDSHTRNVLAAIRDRRKLRDAVKARDFEETRREFREKLTERLAYNHGSAIRVPRRAADPPVPKHRELVLPPSARVDRP